MPLLLSIGPWEVSKMLFGMDFITITMLSLPGLAGFLEFYATSLAADKNGGLLAFVMFAGKSKIMYFVAKLIIPLCVAALATFLSIALYLVLAGSEVLLQESTVLLVLAVGAEVFLAMGLGMMLNVLFNIDIKTNPGIAIPLLLINLPQIYFANPITHFAIFAAIAIGLGACTYVASFILLAERYRGNLTLS